jgi:hypothetical protein
MNHLLRQRSVLWAASVLCFFLAGPSSAAEQLTIGQLKKSHASYHMQSVTVVGQVRSMRIFPPLPSFRSKQCNLLYGVAQFELVDDSGTLPVETLGTCFVSATTLPGDGDPIELTAQIKVIPPDGRTERVIKAIAQNIVIVKPVSHPAR